MRTLFQNFLLGLVLLYAAAAFAQQEPPARVGRVSIADGAVAFFGAGDADWSAAQVNLPVAEGGWFATDPQSRAQLRIGPDTAALAPGTELNVAALRQDWLQIAMTQGRIYLHLGQSPAISETDEVDLARGGVWLAQPGIYDIASGTAAEPTRITVFEGRARFVGGGLDRTIHPGEQLLVSGSGVLSAELQPAGSDSFDEWCRAHEPRPPRVATAHVSAAMTDVGTLADYGTWDSTPQYGTVWFPQSLPADWAPYRRGRWVWIEPWGWNWVDYEPWGFAPFHYGRWARIADRWAWVPGEYVPEPVYAPALVAFIAAPAIEAAVPIGLAAAGPPVGWFPLAPGEVYWPTYARDPNYIRNVNITNVSITKITNITGGMNRQPAAPPPQVVNQPFANRSAATVVPARVFRNSAPVAPAAVALPAAILQKASVAVRPPPVVAAPAAAAAIKPASRAGATAASTPSGTAARTTPAQPPPKPQFARLLAAPRVSETSPALTAPAAKGLAAKPPAAPAPTAPAALSPAAPAPTAPAAESTATQKPPPTPGAAGGRRPPTAPNFSHLEPAKPPTRAPAASLPGRQPPAEITANHPPAAAGKPAEQAAAPNPAHRPPRPNFGQPAPASTAPSTAQPRQGSPAPSTTQAPQRPLQAHPGPPEANGSVPRAANHPTAGRALEEQTRLQAAQQAQQRAAAEAARQHAAQAAQQKAAAQAAQQHAAQTEQQRAAAETAHQRAAQAAQQKAAAQAVRPHAAEQTHRQEPACGRPGTPPCPK